MRELVGRISACRELVGRLRLRTASGSMDEGTSGPRMASHGGCRAPLDGSYLLHCCRGLCLGPPASRAAKRCRHRNFRNGPSFGGYRIRALRLVAGAPLYAGPAPDASRHLVGAGRLCRCLALARELARAVWPGPAGCLFGSRFWKCLELVSPREMDAGPVGVARERRSIRGAGIPAARLHHSPFPAVRLVALAKNDIQPAGARARRNHRRRPCLIAATFVHSASARWLRLRPDASRALLRPPPVPVARELRPAAHPTSRSPFLEPKLSPRRS